MIVYKATDHAQHDSWGECDTLAHLHRMMHGNPSRLYEVLEIIKFNDDGEAYRFAHPEKKLEQEGRRLRMIELTVEIQRKKAYVAEREAEYAELAKESK